MIERLNFYDLYGYLIPGLCLLGVLWFPFWFVASVDLPEAWTSALSALVLAYVAGHLLQRLARDAFPQGFANADGRRRYPSDYLLDDDGTWQPVNYPVTLRTEHFSPDVRTAMAAAIQRTFGINVAGPADALRTARRRDAFLLCRRALLQQGAGSYAEQFEGMYSLMRGLTAVASLGAPFTVGWALGWSAATWTPIPFASVVAHVALVVVVVWTAAFREDGFALYWLAGAIAAPLGAYLGGSRAAVGEATVEGVVVLVGTTALLIFAAIQFHGAYRYFSVHFAATIYRDFLVLSRRLDRITA